VRSRLAVLAALLVLPACAQSADPEPTAARSGKDDLVAELDEMVVPQGDVGGLPLGLRVTPDSGWHDNRAAAESTLDSSDSAASLDKAGRVTGYELTHYDPTETALHAGRGLLSFFTSVELFESEAAASAYLDTRAAYRQSLDETSPEEGVTFRSVAPFDTRVGEGRGYAFREDVVFGEDHVFRTLIGFRRGRIVGTVMFVRADRDDATADATRLAGILDSRIQNALGGKIAEDPVLIPEDGVPLDGQKPTMQKPPGVPDLAEVALGAADLPTGIAADPGKYTRTKPPRITFRRSFFPQGAAIGQTQLVGLNNEVHVFESEAAAAGSLALTVTIINTPDALKTFATNFAATSGLRATNMRRRQVPLENGVVGFITTFHTDAGRLVSFEAMAQRGRGTVMVETFSPADAFRQEDVLPLLDTVADRLEAALA
jgi:hypothetical protein